MNKTKKIIIIIVILLLILLFVGLALGLLLSRSSTIELEVWPHDTNNPSLIKYRTDDGSFLKWNERLVEFLKEYKQNPLQSSSDSGVQRVFCNYNTRLLGEKQVCDVPLDTYFPCNENFNFQETKPCLFFRLNKVRNWTPVPFNNTAVMPKNMPNHLRQYIRIVQNAPEANNVWLSCDGRDPEDKENIGPIQYIPRRGFPVFYFPFTNKEGYLNPILAVYFERPKTGVLINVVCTAWAKNIQTEEDGQQGTVHFSLQIN